MDCRVKSTIRFYFTMFIIVVEKIAKIRILYINDLAFGENYENQII